MHPCHLVLHPCTFVSKFKFISRLMLYIYNVLIKFLSWSLMRKKQNDERYQNAIYLHYFLCPAGGEYSGSKKK